MVYGLWSHPGPPEVSYIGGAAAFENGRAFRRGVRVQVPEAECARLTDWKTGGRWIRSDRILRRVNARLLAKAPPGAEVLVIREEGLGDAIMASAATLALAEKRPDLKIAFVTKKAYAPLFDGDWPVHGVSFIEELRGRFDWVLDLGPYEQREHVGPRVDRKVGFAKGLGVSLGDTPRFPVFVKESAIEGARKATLALRGARFGLIAPASASRMRAIPPGVADGIARILEANGLFPVTVGPKDYRTALGSLDLTGRTDVSLLAALISLSAVTVCPDSGPSHLAGALGRPAVVIYTEVPPEMRTWGYQSLFPAHWERGFEGRNADELTGLVETAVGFGKRGGISAIDREKMACTAIAENVV